MPSVGTCEPQPSIRLLLSAGRPQPAPVLRGSRYKFKLSYTDTEAYYERHDPPGHSVYVKGSADC